MAFEQVTDGALDYHPCHYRGSRQAFRGPQKDLDAPYMAFLGSTATYGRFVETPFPDLVEATIGTPCVNLGCVNAGVDAFIHDPDVMSIARGAEATVIQIMGAQNMSNRFYTVHPRRNDRFVRPSDAMKEIFPQVDFTEFAFTRHLLNELHNASRHQFEHVCEELKAAWVSRMKLMIEEIGGRIVLLWMGLEPPSASTAGLDEEMSDPAFVDQAMIEEIRPLTDAYVEVVARPQDSSHTCNGMIYSELDAPAAARTPAPLAHRKAADALAPIINGLRS